MTRTRRILQAIHDGAQTSREIAQMIGGDRSRISVALHRLANEGYVERAGVINKVQIGRPYVRWRLKRPSHSSSVTLFSQTAGNPNTTAVE